MTKTRTSKPVAYLAGPHVFLPKAIAIGEEKKRICRSRGLEAKFPLDGAAHTKPATGHQIFRDCVELMDKCNLVIVNMTPFRGVSMDVGSAVEIGYMYARGYPIFGYTNDVRDYAERVAVYSKLASERDLEVEDHKFTDNLMCEGSVWWSSHEPIVRTRVKRPERLTDLDGFIACVEEAAKLFGIS